MPAEAVRAIIYDDYEKQDPRYISPSKISPLNQCRREIVIEHYQPFAVDLLKRWEALEGNLWHGMFSRMSAGEGWMSEVKLPDDLLSEGRARELEDEGLLKECEDGKLRLQVMPGVWVRGTGDRIRDDFLVYCDHKSKRWPFSRPPGHEPSPKYGPEGQYTRESVKDWAFQFSTYSKMIEMCTGVLPQEQWAWQVFRGSKNRAHTFRKIPVPLRSAVDMWGEISEWTTQLLKWLDEAHGLGEQALENFIQKIPLDGHDRQLFNGQKCSKYCEAQGCCFALAGMMEF